MSTKYGTLLVIGSGPGIGRNVARLFASRGFQQVVLLSRDASRLEDDASFVKLAAPDTTVHIVPADLGDKNSTNKALEKTEGQLQAHPLQAVLYNAARVGVSKFFDWSVEELEKDLHITVTGLYSVASWAVPQLAKLAASPTSKGKAAFMVTSGLLHQEPFPHLFSLSTCKAAQYNLVHSLYKEFGPKGVHCGLVVVGGVVKDDAKVTTAAKIAEEAWGLYSQEKGKWQLSVRVLDPDYNEMVRGRERSGEVW